MAENSLLSETVDELRLRLASEISSLSAEWDRERGALMAQLKDLSSQVVAMTATSKPSPLPDEDDSSALAEGDVAELKNKLERLTGRLSQVRRANSKLLQHLQALKGNIQAMFAQSRRLGNRFAGDVSNTTLKRAGARGRSQGHS